MSKDHVHVVYFFCMDEKLDPVAPRVFEATQRLYPLNETDLVIDGYPVLTLEAGGILKSYVRTETILCMAYDRYIPGINAHFSGAQLGVMVNWHGGQSAPDKVLCVHTVGDVESATFGASAPAISTSLMRQLEKQRIQAGLDDFTVTSEATHWSGIVYGGETQWIKAVKVPFLDLEIGSTPESYENVLAAEVIAKALAEVKPWVGELPVVLYCGGMHFEETITRAILHETHPVALTHILPSRWLQNEKYVGEAGIQALLACGDAIDCPLDAVVIHEKLDRVQRELLAAFAEQKDIPLFKRKALKDPEQLGLHGIRG